MHAKSLFLFPVALLVLHPAAYADFRLQAPPESSNIPAPAPAMPFDDLGDHKAGQPVPGHSRFPLAKGFGRQVPMSFATRQIVPHTAVIRFGPGVDLDAPVTWSGGRPWNRVLASAVRPLRLRVTATTNAVVISH